MFLAGSLQADDIGGAARLTTRGWCFDEVVQAAQNRPRLDTLALGTDGHVSGLSEEEAAIQPVSLFSNIML
jgi:hypothetical protein